MQTDFSKYKTYKYEKHPDSMDVDSLTLGMIAQGFDAEFAKKGLTRVDENPDLIFVFQLAVRSEKEMTTWNTGYSMGPAWGPYWYGYGGGMYSGTSTTTSNTIMIGSAAVDMYDPAAKKIVWRGTVTKTLDPKATPDKTKKNIAKSAKKLLKDFPPKPKKK
jgi:hypothetical protein